MTNFQLSQKFTAALSALWIACAALPANSATIDINGAIDVVFTDSGTSIFAGATPGVTQVTGFIDDVTFNGELSNGATSVAFGCCIAAGGLDFSNDLILDADTAAFLSLLAAGSHVYSEGDLVDGVDIEGDVLTPSGGRIEIGVSYLLNADTFASPADFHYPFDSSAIQLALFFILEEDASGTDIFDAVGSIRPVPEPSTFALWLLGAVFLSRVPRKPK